MNNYFVDSDEKVKEAITLLGDEKVIALDSESSGLRPYIDRLWCIQLCNGNDNILFPYNAMDENSRNLLRKYLKDKICVAHNAKHDFKFLKLNGFDVEELYCTQITEKNLYQGKYFTWGLKDLTHRRFQITMSKEERKIFYSTNPNEKSEFEKLVDLYGEWGAWENCPEAVEYALTDTEYLLEIRDQQLEEAKGFGMESLIRMENAIIKSVANTELRGVYLDKEETKKFESVVVERRDILGLEISTLLETSWQEYWLAEFTRRMELWNTWQLGHREVVLKSNQMRSSEDKRKKSEDALKMVEESNKKKPFATQPKAENPFNANSPLKLKPALSNLVGFDIPNTTKQWLEDNANVHPVLFTLVEYRKYEKLAQFCQMTENINPITGKVHSNFDQVGTVGGRFSSYDVNLQQIPSKSDEAQQFRALFKAEKGYKFIGADFSGIELVILAEYSDEQILIDAINSGKDVHIFTMSLFLNCEYEILLKLKKEKELTKEETEKFTVARQYFESRFAMQDLLGLENPKWVSVFRNNVKTLVYGLSYGLSAYGLSNKFHCSFEDAQEFINIFFSYYPNLDKFLKNQSEVSWERGYALNPFGRRRYFTKPRIKSYKEIEAEQIKELNKQKRLWDSVSDKEWYDIMQKAIEDSKKEFKGKINSIKRQAGNFFPQSLCAEMIKISLYLFDKYYESKEKDGVWALIHDETLAQIKEERVEMASIALKKAMEKSARKFLKKVEVNIEVTVSDCWVKG